MKSATAQKNRYRSIAAPWGAKKQAPSIAGGRIVAIGKYSRKDQLRGDESTTRMLVRRSSWLLDRNRFGRSGGRMEHDHVETQLLSNRRLDVEMASPPLAGFAAICAFFRKSAIRRSCAKGTSKVTSDIS